MVKLLVSRKKALKMIEESAQKATLKDFIEFIKSVEGDKQMNDEERSKRVLKSIDAFNETVDIMDNDEICSEIAGLMIILEQRDNCTIDESFKMISKSVEEIINGIKNREEE